MALKLSIFTTATRPDKRGDLYEASLDCYTDLADEVIVVDGAKYDRPFEAMENALCLYLDSDEKIMTIHEIWPEDFSWPFIGEQFTRGYEACIGDWVIHCDLDFIFHQKDFGKIRQALRDYPTVPAVSFYKYQFILPDRYNLKSRLLLAVNKKVYGDRITFSGGGDLCQPQLDGKDLSLDEMPQAGVPFYNYEKLLKTKKQIMEDQGRMERAYFRHFGHYQLAEDDTDESAYEGWLRMQQGRFNKPQEKIPLSAHPRYVQETIKNLTPKQWGYNGFGLTEGKTYG